MTTNNSGKLFLIPNIIHSNTENLVVAPIIFDVIKETKYYLVENVRTARRYLSSLMHLLPERDRTPISELLFEKLDKNTSVEEVTEMLERVRNGKNCGIISESGCPGIADPGTEAAKVAHKMKIEVVPLPGPSSIFLALMASGMNGQSFTFHGYLPIDKSELISKIRKLENEAWSNKQSQIFIETPYRNQRLFEMLLSVCGKDLSLCIATNITGPEAMIKTMKIHEWRSSRMRFNKAPTVFLLSA